MIQYILNINPMHKKRLTLKILLFLIMTDVLETSAQFFFKKTAMPESGLSIKNLPDLYIFIKTAFFSPYIWVGFLCVFLIFVIWSTILSKIDLSVAVPVASSSYILIPIVSIIFLHEKVTFLRWFGILFIILGVIFVSASTREKEANLP